MLRKYLPPGLLALVFFPAAVRAADTVLTTRSGQVEVKLFLPAEARVLRGLLIHVANYKLNPADRWGELCRTLHFGHVVEQIDLRTTNRPAKLRKALHEALKEFADRSGHKELAHVPFVGLGHSAGGMVVPVILATPERALTYCVDCAWVVDPDKLSPAAARVPALFTMGAIPDAFKMLPDIKKHFEPARKRGLAWGLGMQWGCAHHFGNSATLFEAWIRAVVRARLPRDADPARGPVRLRELKPEDGWLGDRATIASQFATVAPLAEYRGDRARAAWFPDRATAYVWRAYESKEPPVVLEAATVDGKTRLPAPAPRKGRDLMIGPGEGLVLRVTVKDGTALRRVSFYDGDTLLGEAAAPAWQITWKKPARGPHALFALYETGAGKPGTTNPALITVRQK